MRQRRAYPFGLSLQVVLAGLMQAASLAWPANGESALEGLLGLQRGAPLPWVQLVALAWAVRVITSADTPRQSGWLAWLSATTAGAGTTWWLYVSMVHYGQVPPPLGVIAVLTLAAFLSLPFGMLGWSWRQTRHTRWAPWVFGLGWMLAEWLRGWLWTGFPWANIASGHVDGLGVLAPWLGASGVAVVVASLAAQMAISEGITLVSWTFLGALMVWPGSPWAHWDWSMTRASGTAKVSLLQGNIDQADKFDPQKGVPQALSWYPKAIASSPPSDLILAPETAIPLLPQDVSPAKWFDFAQAVAHQEAAVAIGVPIVEGDQRYFNAVWWWTPERATRALNGASLHGQDFVEATYAKTHLVPFGEYTPWGFQWFAAMLGMPLSGFESGPRHQASINWAGQRWGFQICYEDVFGPELAARMAQDAPSVWINVSNIAWFGNTVAIDQHLNIARWRARELGRSVVRATNTGATAVIDHLGRVTAQLEPFTRGVLHESVQGREGLTPYVRWIGRWHDLPWVLVGVLVWWWAWRSRTQAHQRPDS